jgi:hypothetical protein
MVGLDTLERSEISRMETPLKPFSANNRAALVNIFVLVSL